MNARGETIRLATRGSALARRQAATVAEALESRRREVDLVEVETTGDQVRDELIHRLGTTGAFVRSLDEELLDGSVDAAVHSMKDVPTESHPELVIAGVPERAGAGDVLVAPEGQTLAALPEGATVGTSSLRRGAQLCAARPDLEIEPLRGNVDTRVEKLLAPSLQREHEARLAAADGDSGGHSADGDGDSDDEAGAQGEADSDVDAGGDTDSDAEAATADVEAATGGDDAGHRSFERSVQAWFDGLREIERRALERDVETEYDAIVLAAAGLERTGLIHAVPTTRLDRTEFVPAPGQGALAVTARDDDLGARLQDLLDHPPTRVETTVERVVLDELGGGCVAPIGVHARLQGSVVTTSVRVLARAGSEEVGASRELPVERHAEAARSVAAELADRGAADIIAAARRSEPDEAKRG